MNQLSTDLVLLEAALMDEAAGVGKPDAERADYEPDEPVGQDEGQEMAEEELDPAAADANVEDMD